MHASYQTKIVLLIARLDTLIENQLSRILHHPAVEELLTIWSELSLISHATHTNKSILVKLLDINWQEIDKDINNSLELENSILYYKVCEDQFGIAGGEPFGLILANYELDLRKINIISTLNRLSELGALSLVPIFTNLSMATFSMTSYEVATNLDKEIDVTDLTQWQKFRKSPQARFLYLALPMLKLAIPKNSQDRLPLVNSINLRAATLLAIRTIESFNESHWFSEVPGFFDAAILHVDKLPLDIGKDGLQLNCCLYLKSAEEKALTSSGFISIMQNKKDDLVYFSNIYSSYADNNTTGLLLEHMLSACRFGHLIKVIARQKIGSLTSESECEQYISQWLNRYTGTFHERSLRSKFPLKKHLVRIHKIPGKVGSYNCQILLEPHMKLENMNAQIMLHSEIYAPNI